MKRIFLLASAWMLGSMAVSAQTSDNFNSRPSITTTQVKGHLQGHCWAFPDFDVNRNGWIPGIEGDGAMVSGPSSSSTQSTGIYTPLLQVPGYINVSFKYKFNSSFGGSTRRWMKLYLVDHNNEIQMMLDSVEFSGVNASTVYNYNKSFGAGSGYYKLYINYQGIGGSTRIAIDELLVSASMVYAQGCNEPPVAVNDVINGAANRTASGHICNNDSDPNGDSFTSYVITSSPDGTVTINPDNSFTFTPNPGFSGNTTSFTYQICDNGFAPLCSNTATVTINFPTGGFLPVSLIDLTGIYKNDGNVDINWVTTFEQNSDRFEVERSLDGIRWETAGTLKAAGTSSVKKNYTYTDKVGRNTANKKDLYYRLKMVDLDGKTAISRILVVRVYNTRSTKMISVSPNPAKNDIMATVQLNEASVVSMKVFNAAGIEVMRKTLRLSEGSNSILLDGTSKLQPGLYMLEVVVNSKERMLVKLIKE